MKRLVEPELLDTLPPDDPQAVGSRRDLRRVNWWMGNQRLMRRALREHLPAAPPGPLMEIGAGDGNFLLSVLEGLSLPWAEKKAILLDRQKSVRPEMTEAFCRLGWQAEPVVADVFEHPSGPVPLAAIVANLFLHHFEEDALARLLAKISRETSLFIAVEPYRFPQPWLCGQLLRVIGCNAVTLHDAVVSVRAGFLNREIAALWPDPAGWRITERRAGFFSHLFIAQRIP